MYDNLAQHQSRQNIKILLHSRNAGGEPGLIIYCDNSYIAGSATDVFALFERLYIHKI